MTQSQKINSTAEAIFEAHVAFELEQWRGDGAVKRLQDEVDAFWQWAEQTPLETVVSVDTVRGAAERLALDMSLPDDLAEVIGGIANDLICHDVNKKTRVQDVIDESLFDDGVSLFVELEALRARLITRLLDSPVYTALASDVLYQGIKDYIFSDTGAIKSIPGVSSLLKGSSSALSKRMPGLEAQVEKRVRAYIENNTAKTLARSQELLIESLDEERIRAIASEIWAEIHDKKLSIEDVVDNDELQKLVDYGLRIWQELRETQYVGELVDAAVVSYFERNGSRKLTEVLGDVGVSRDLLRQEAETLAPPVIEGLAESGLLEDLVRRRLGAFYASDAFEKALGQANK
ncbi:hypothetical protein T35B1_13728 [Salinisphaera shabanensis T35B1]|uniref:hypothetical protein n=1 Tax=Salinisphaera shabanensis TaxID=180542 RepID=UPI00334092BB